MRGNAVVGEAAIKAGCTCYFGYPITPQNQLPEYMSRRLVETGGVFIQSESEISAINMALGASVAGARVMTSSSSPGISLKQEGISFLAGCELPCVIVNMARGRARISATYLLPNPTIFRPPGAAVTATIVRSSMPPPPARNWPI